MLKSTKPVLLALVLSGMMTIVGCSSSPSEEQMRQLNDLKAEVSRSEERRVGKECRL